MNQDDVVERDDRRATARMTRGQVAVLVLAAVPMAAVGIAGGIATYTNMDNVLHRGASALGLVAAGEGATLIAALVALAVTLMGQHTPPVVRIGMWLAPLIASATGVALAPTRTEAVVMGVTPLAMTAAGEGMAFVARRVVAYRTGVDLEAQRRNGLLLWHANRAANGGALGRRLSNRAVWRLTKAGAATDGQLSAQISEILRDRISAGADANLAAVFGQSPQNTPDALPGPRAALPPAEVAEAPQEAPEGPKGGFMTDVSDYMKTGIEEAMEGILDDPPVKLLTGAEVAELAHVKEATVRTWNHRGKLAPYETIAGRPMFHPDDIPKKKGA